MTESKPLKFIAVLTVKNEAAFLLEWLAHHRATGFTDFLVFSNDCDDGTSQMLDRLSEMGWLHHVRNDGPYHERGIQFTALKAAQRHPAVKAADWILPLDIDEFVNIKTGAHRLPDLLAALPHANAITLTWRLFGNNGIERYEDRPVTSQFTRCAPEVATWPWRASMFKTLYKNDGSYKALGVHRPRNPDDARLSDIHWYDCEGRALDPMFKTKRIFSSFGRPNYGLAQLNHYALGAKESFLLKSDRGRVNHTQDKMTMDYWVERDFNEVEDTSIMALQEDREALRQELLHDAVLGPLHAQAVDWRKKRFAALMRDEPHRALYGRLLMAGPTKMLSMQKAQFMVRCAQSDPDS